MTTLNSQDRASDLTIEETLTNEACDLLLACVANQLRGDRKKMWSMAQKALRVGSERGSDFKRMVSEMHDQMMDPDQPFSKETSSKISSIGEVLKSRGQYNRFRQICRRDAPYIVLRARVSWENKKADPDMMSDWIDDPSE